MFDKIKNEWLDAPIVMYGYGRQGKSYLPQFQALNKLQYIIDNACVAGQHESIDGITILNYEDYKKTGDESKIVVTASGKSHMSITNSLLSDGKKEMEDYMDADYFLSLLGWLTEGGVKLGRVIIPVTEVCTLKCEKCMVCAPYNKHPQIYSLASLNEDADRLFNSVDHIGTLQISGGEPFSNAALPEYICYVQENYGDRIDSIQIISNGTLIPKPDLLSILKKYNNINMRFTDYTEVIPYKDRFEEVLAVMQKNDILYVVEKFDWLDMGNPMDNISVANTPEGIHRHMIDCCGRCQTYHGGKYYYCSRQWAAECVYGIKLDVGDTIDINNRSEIIPFHIGEMEKGYCEFCNKCRGFDLGEPIKAGIQMKNNVAKAL